MKDELVAVYYALTVDDAQRLSDILDERGIEAFVETTSSPLYMTQGPAAHLVRVRQPAVASAREVVRKYEAQWHPGVPRDEQQYEETGFELPDDPIPSQDDPNEENFMGNERNDTERPGPESAEVEDLITEDKSREEVDWHEHHIVGFGADRGMTQEPDVDASEFEEQKIDELHIEAQLDEPETGTPAANVRPERKREQPKRKERE